MSDERRAELLGMTSLGLASLAREEVDFARKKVEREYTTGRRGGEYYLSASGTKVYRKSVGSTGADAEQTEAPEKTESRAEKQRRKDRELHAVVERISKQREEAKAAAAAAANASARKQAHGMLEESLKRHSFHAKEAVKHATDLDHHVRQYNYHASMGNANNTLVAALNPFDSRAGEHYQLALHHQERAKEAERNLDWHSEKRDEHLEEAKSQAKALGIKLTQGGKPLN